MITNKHHLLACLLIGCTSAGETASGGASDGTDPRDPTEPGAPGSPGDPANAETGEGAGPPASPLVRGLGHEHAITEVWLDPRASAALTLDRSGGVRLWPALPPATKQLDALAPIRVPVYEPRALSFARAGENEFLLAAIDTAQAARVLSITLDADGQAKVRERFATPPADPLLELHVLDGGTRLLALGVDHRIRLYDADGKLLSELREHGLVPWQLRIAGPPEALQLAMVLAGPTRLQRFEIVGDQLRKRGEPRAFVLDRGPNQNDLALLPSGKVAAVLRRPKAKGQQFSLELHDLDSGEVRVLWSELEAKWRPRLHIIDDAHALLEDGNHGYWLDLTQAVAMPAPFELPKQLESLPPESHVSVEQVPLPGTTRVTRRNASVVAGVRVIPVDFGLIIDPVWPVTAGAEAKHYELGHRGMKVESLALDEHGEHLAGIYGDKVIVETLATGTELELSCAPDKPQALYFTDASHLLLVGAREARICEWPTSAIGSILDLPEHLATRVRLRGRGNGELAVQLPWEKGELQLSHANIEANGLGPLEPMTKEQFERWPEFEDEQWDTIDAAGNRFEASAYSTRKLSVTLADGGKRKIPLADEDRRITRIEPAGDGRTVAVVSQQAVEYEEYGYGYNYDSEPPQLAIWSFGEDPPEQHANVLIGSAFIDLVWTGDGSRLAFVDGGRLHVMTRDGERVLDRGTRGFHLDELPDQVGEAPPPAADPPAN